jgi:hypothetical protein
MAALDANADVALLSVRPTTAKVGQRVEVRAGAYKQFAPMPLYLVARAEVPKPHPCGPKTKEGKPSGFCELVLANPPHGARFHFVGRLDFRRHPRNVQLDFRVPPVAAGMYEFVIYCDPCQRGSGGTLITGLAPALCLRAAAPLGQANCIAGAVGKDSKIVFRVTGSGPIHLSARTGHAKALKPDWGPQEHGGSTWNRSGGEWGIGFTFPTAGCYRLRAERSGTSGDVWMLIR